MGRKGQRLGISEYHEIDKTRRLVLVRRDETEHLILIGGAQDLVVESGISLNSGMDDVREAPARPFRSAPHPRTCVRRRAPPGAKARRAADDVTAQLRARRELRRNAFSSVYG